MEKNILAENMRRFRTKNLNEDQLNEIMHIDPEAVQHLITMVTDLGLPAWTALPIGIGIVGIPAAAIGGKFGELRDAIKHKIRRRKLTPDEAERFSIEVETALKDIPGPQRGYLTSLLNKYKQALAAEAGGLDMVNNIDGADAKDIMIRYMDLLNNYLKQDKYKQNNDYSDFNGNEKYGLLRGS